MARQNNNDAKRIGVLNGDLLVTNGVLARGVDSTGSKNLVMGRDGVFYCQCHSWVYRKGTKAYMGNERTCKHMRPFMDANGAPVLATPSLLTAWERTQVEDAPSDAPSARGVETAGTEPAPVEPKRGRGRPALTASEKEVVASLLAAGFSKDEARIVLRGLKALGR